MTIASDGAPPVPSAGGGTILGWLDGLPPLFWVAVAAALIAFWGVSTQRIIARRKATLDYIVRQENDGDVIQARLEFIQAAKSPGGLSPWAEKDKESEKTAQSIKIVLNEMELISIGIQKGVIDFDMYKRWNKSGTLNYWTNSAPFIFALRARLKNDSIYHEFEQLVGWLKDNKMPKRNRFLGYWW